MTVNMELRELIETMRLPREARRELLNQVECSIGFVNDERLKRRLQRLRELLKASVWGDGVYDELLAVNKLPF